VRAAALRSIEADLRRYLGVEAAGGCEWRPERLELRFGFDDEDSLPALELADGVRVRGMIDRVDVEPGGRRAIVRDYKSSASTSHPRARWILDRRVQLALYMLVVRDLLELRPVAGFYQPLGGREPRPRGVYVAGAPVPATAAEKDCLEQEELDEALAQAAALAVELASTLRSGVLAPAPETCSRTGCAYPAICRSG
jgi:RecB family exonuclease